VLRGRNCIEGRAAAIPLAPVTRAPPGCSISSGLRGDRITVIASAGTTAQPETGTREMFGQTFRTPSRGDRLARNPVEAVLAPLSFPVRRGGIVRLSLGAVIYPISIALVSAATVSVFFGIGFSLMVQRPVGSYGEALAASAEATPTPVDATRPSAASVTALPAVAPATSSASKTGEVRGREPMFAASGPAVGGGAESSGIADRPTGSAVVALARMMPADTAATQQAAKPSTAPAAVAQTSNPHLSAAEIAALLAHGNAAFRKGDIAAARLLFQRAADAGEGRGALGMGATFDPAFLRISPLRILYGDPAEAREWYLHALVLGAAGAERRLVNLQARQARAAR
jgi:hypothetical protein